MTAPSIPRPIESPATNVLDEFSSPIPTQSKPKKVNAVMLRSELYKLIHHRTPWAILAFMTLLASASPIYFMFRSTDAASYVEIPLTVLTLAAVLLMPVFGAWVLGHEYRQDTLKRVVALDGRRDSLVMTKGLVALVGSALAVLFAAAVAIGLSALAASIHGDSLDFSGFAGLLGGSVFAGACVGLISYCASVIFRSDTYAIVGTVGVMSVFGQFLGLIPRIGSYMPPVAMTNVVAYINEPNDLVDGDLTKAMISLGITFAVAIAGARQLFQTRDL